MDFLYGLAFDLLLKLFLDRPPIQQPGPPPAPIFQTLKVEAPQLINIPEWVSSTPENCFVGISRLCQSIEEARQQALESAVSQILQAMGAEYNLKHKSKLSGNARHSQHELRERLIYTARWFIRSVQQNIKKSDIQQIKGKYICFVLIDFPSAKIERLRKLTIGPKVGARVIEENNDQLVIEVIENNGVSVTFTDYHIEIRTKNRHAGIITLFAWKVPESTIINLEGVIGHRVSLKEKSQTFSIPIPVFDTNLKSFILGSENHTKILLRGYDELGRPLSLPVN